LWRCFRECSRRQPPQAKLETAPAPTPVGPRVYESDEVAGGLIVINPATFAVTNMHLGRRARGIHASHDGKMIYVALSGSPIAGPGVDESTHPPPDKSADAIAEFDVAQNNRSSERRHEAIASVRRVNKEGDVIWLTTQESVGAKYHGASADAADEIAGKLKDDFEKARKMR
jgi:hypothetical protein